MRRVFAPDHLACAGRRLPDATTEHAYVSHAANSTIVSNFCQARLWEVQNAECRMQNAKCRMQNEEAAGMHELTLMP
jgi:hypothetical protein